MANAVRRSIYGIFGRGLQLIYGEEVPYLGTPLTAPGDWIAPHTRARIFLRRYERAESALVRDYLLPDIPVLELGCGVGVVGREILAQLQVGMPFIGIEANPALARLAQDNLARLGRESVEVKHGLIGAPVDQGKAVPFAISDGNFRYSSADLVSDPGATLVDVPVVTLSEVVADAGWSEFQIVSDIEGAERVFLEHDTEAIERCVQFVIELHNGDGFKIQDLKAMIEALGFVCVDHQVQTYVFRRPTE